MSKYKVVNSKNEVLSRFNSEIEFYEWVDLQFQKRGGCKKIGSVLTFEDGFKCLYKKD